MQTIFFLYKPMFIALLLTITIELFVLILFRIKSYKIYLILIAVNIVTNLSMNYVLKLLPPYPYDLGLYSLEILVVIIEMFVYYSIIRNFKKTCLLSLACNSLSLVFGLLLMPYIYT